MADHELGASLTADASSFVKGMAEAEGSLDRFIVTAQGVQAAATHAGNAIDDMANRVERGGKKMAATGVAMGAGLGVATAAASGFQREMLNVNSVAQMSSAELGRTGDAVLNISRRLPQSARVLAAGLYDISSSGFAGADALMILEASAVGAAAGLTQTEVSAKAITAILNSYGLAAREASDINDILFQTVNLGVITFEELSATVGDWVGIAGAAGIAADEAAAAIATMTLTGINSAEASTALSRLIEAFVNPSENLAEAVRELGYESALAMVRANGLQGAMAILTEETGGSAEAFTALFPNIRAARGALALASQDGELYANIAGRITDETDRAGAAQAALAVQSQGLGFEWGILRNNMAAFGIEIGNTFLPVLTMMVEGLNMAFDIFNSIPGPIQETIAVLAALSSVLLIGTGLFLAFFAKQVLWGVALRFLSQRFMDLSANITATAGSTTLAARGFDRMGTAAAVAAQRTGPLATVMYGTRAAATGLGSAMGTSAGKAVSFASTMATVGFVVWAARDAYNAAKRSHEDYMRELATNVDTTSIDSISDSIEELRAVADDIADATLGDVFKDVFSPSNLFYGNFADIGSELFGDGAETLQEERDAQRRAVDGLITDMEQRTVTLRNLAAVAVAEAEGIPLAFSNAFGEVELPDLLDGGADIQRAASHLGDFRLGAEESIDTLIQLGIEAGIIDLDQIFAEGDFGNREMLIAQLVEVQEQLNATDPAAAELAGAFSKLSDETLTVTERFDVLSDIMRTIIDDAFALDEATDTVVSGVNEITQEILAASEDGGISNLIDLDNFSDDAIAFRDQFRGFIRDVAGQTDAWARSQENLTGLQLRDYIGDQITEIEKWGEQVGIGTEFLDAMLVPLREIQENPELYVAFNSNLEEQTAALETYLASVGLANTEIQTVVTLLEGDADGAVEDYLKALGLDGDEISTVFEMEVTREAQEALDELNDLHEGIIEPTLDLDTTQFYIELARARRAIAELTGQPIAPTNPGGGTTTYQADGGHYPQIFRGHTRVFNEPETGGEAYIPLSPAKRGMAVPVLMQVMEMFGLAQFNNGGIGIYRPDTISRNTPASDSGGGGGGGGVPGLTREAIIGLLANQYEVGDLGADEYRMHLDKLLASSEKYSNEYTSLWRKIQSLDAEREQAAEDAIQADQDRIREEERLQAVQFAVGATDRDAYITFLKGRLDSLEEYSDDWFGIWSEINSFENQMAQEEEARLSERRRVEDLKYEIGETSTAEYLGTLRDRLAGLEQYSEEWAQVWREIQRVEEVALEESAVDPVTSNRLSSVAGQGFVAPTQLTAYYERKAREAVEWYGIVQKLSSSGVSGILIQDLLAAGPTSLPLAKAVERLHNSGELAGLTTSLQTIDAVSRVSGSFVGNVGTPLTSLGANLGGEGAVIQTGDLYFTGIDDVKEFIDRIEFELGAV